MKYILIPLLLVLPYISPAQAWLKKKGKGYQQIGFSSISNNRIYNRSNPELQLRRPVNDMTISEYFEYGITHKLTFVANIPFKMVNTRPFIIDGAYLPDTLKAGKLNMLSNISFSGVYALRQKENWVSSFKLNITLSTAKYQHDIGLRTGYDAMGVAPSILFGKSIKNHFATFELGANYRTNSYSSQLFSNAQIGTKIKNKVYTILVLDYLTSLKNGTYDDGNSIHTGLYMNDIEWIAFLLKVGCPITEKITVWGALGGGIYGYAVARAPSFSLALSYAW